MDTCVAENSVNVEGGALSAAIYSDKTEKILTINVATPDKSQNDGCCSVENRQKSPKNKTHPNSPCSTTSCEAVNSNLSTVTLEENSQNKDSLSISPEDFETLTLSESNDTKPSSTEATKSSVNSPGKAIHPKVNSKVTPNNVVPIQAATTVESLCGQTAKSVGAASTSKHPLPGTINSIAGKPEKNTKRNREEKMRKKDDKSVEHVLRALSSLETTEEKLGAMCQKYADIVNEHRLLQNAAKLCEKKNSSLQKEKEQLQADQSKAILTRNRLENLCRELQRQNKAIKEECMLKIREEEEKKREVATKFQSTLTEFSNLLAQNNDKNAKLRDDNLDMTTKLKNVCEQYERKEQHVEKLAKQMKLEMQLADAKLAKAKMEMAMEKETLLREKQILLLELNQYQTQLKEMKLTETALHNQIKLYNDKYDEFHRALLQSNEAIGGFKQEMERMSKQIRKLEKETVNWKSRYEAAHQTLLQMSEDKLKSDQNASAASRKLVALERLCRSLQAQCTTLRNDLKGVATTNVASVLEEDLMNQVEKELSTTEIEEGGLANDNSPCPRHLSRETPEKAISELEENNSAPQCVVSSHSSSSIPNEENCVHSLDNKPEEIPPSTMSSETETNSTVIVSDSSLQNDPVIPNGEMEMIGDEIQCAPTSQQTKKNKSKKKNKKC